MLKNIVFDMGGVLLRYEPLYFIQRAGITGKQEIDLLMENVFLSQNWKRQDLGEIDEQQTYEDCIRILPPHLHGVAHDLIFSWFEPMEAIQGMEELISSLKEKNYHIYLLSNASKLQPQYWNKVPGHQYFDGMVISALEHCVKPSQRIYQILLERYYLNPEECLFIDDMKANIEAAMEIGMDGFLFENNVDKLKQYITEKEKENADK